jgi:hypothetical protein
MKLGEAAGVAEGWDAGVSEGNEHDAGSEIREG